MRSDHYRNVVLTLIAVCLSALTLTGIGLPDFTTEAEATVAPASASQDLKKPGGEAGPVRAPVATLPLRWKIPWAIESAATATTFCGTAIVVTNASASPLDIQVEWFDYLGNSMALRPILGLGKFTQAIWVSGVTTASSGIDYRPFNPDDWAGIGSIAAGFARVHADDPRIEAAAFQYCRDGLGITANIMSITNIPAFPVGATMEYFQAGMPATWTPPMAVPELPE